MVNRRRKHWHFCTLGRRSLQLAAVTLLAGAAILGITFSPVDNESFERGAQSDGGLPARNAAGDAAPLLQGWLPGGAKSTVAAQGVGSSVREAEPLVTKPGTLAPPEPVPATSSQSPKVNASTVLGFIHIPLNGGQAIEELSQREGLGWISPESESWPWQGKPVVLGEGYPCGRRQAPPSVLGAPVARESFCIVRDPYERLVEEFKRVASESPKVFVTFDECFESLNTFVHDSLKWLLGDQTRPRQPYASNCQFLPQAAYVRGWETQSMRVNESGRSCSTVLKFETLREDANRLFEARGYSQRLPKTNSPVPKACPMLDRFCLSPHSRSLIEKAFDSDFRLLGFSRVAFVEFIHIPRSGGSAIEDTGKPYYGWGSLNEEVHGPKTIGFGSCQGQHTPPSHLQEIFTGRETFCIVRNVYNKMTSQFRLLVVDTNDGSVPYKCSKKDLNKFVYDYLAGKGKVGFPYGSDCHFLPQGAFVYSWDSDNLKVDTSKRWCTHAIQYERLHDDVNALWRSKGYPMRIKKQTFGGKGRECSLKATDFTEESMALINETYREDILLLERLRTDKPTWSTEGVDPPTLPPVDGGGHELVDKAKKAPKERTLVLPEQEIRHAKLVADDLITAEEFELSFDITPRATVGNSGISNILRITSSNHNYGGAGDRMPAFSFWARSTKLLAYMGRPQNHNPECSTDPLPVGRASRVVARLQGETFTVWVNGKKGCTIGNYVTKYKAMERVKVWISDRWDAAPDAMIGHVVYRAGPLQPQPSQQKRELVFISIPLNGERVIEELSEPGPAGWGGQNSFLAGQTMEFSQGHTCKMSSVPPSLVPWVYAHKETFCVVRDPYARMISEFRRSADESTTQKPEECEAALNAFLHRNLVRVLGDARNSARPFATDCRFLPQAAYVYSWHLKSERVDIRQRRCSHVLRYERLVEEASTLLGSSGYSRHPVQLPAEAEACPSVEKASLNRTTRTLIDLAFREDFRLLGFTRMDGKPPVVRTLLIDKRNVHEGGDIVSDLLTAADFELSFELTPLERAGDGGGGVLGLGTVLVCELMQGTSRLQCSAVHEAEAKGHCATPEPGLPLRSASQVAVRLLGESLEVYVNETLACKVQGLAARQGAAAGAVSFWIGGKLQRAAVATVAAVHYKVQAEPEAAAWGAPRLVTSRTLLSGTQKCERNKLVTTGIATFEEFELSFDVEAKSKPGIEGMLNNLFLMTTTDNHYGHPGDRMPALFFVGGSTKLIAYMGHANDPNENCAAGGDGLVPGRASRVVLRLVGAVFRIFINGKEVCSKEGYTARYSPVRNARLYISDRFSEPARAKISNMVYKVAGWNEDVDVWTPLKREGE